MTEKQFINKNFVKSNLPRREKISHKGTFGSVVNIAGSINYKGAAVLSSVAPLKVGAGYVLYCGINDVIKSFMNFSDGIVFFPLEEKDGCISASEYKSVVDLVKKHDVVSLGCGLCSMNYSQENIKQFVKKFFIAIENMTMPVVIDADGLNLIAELDGIKLPQNTILTPHPKEMSRLLKVNIYEIQACREKYALIAAQKFNSIVLLKGHETIITDGHALYQNTTGNSSLAKAGSGDVLTGMISGFLAQKLSPLFATACAAYLHGLAGELAGNDLSEYSVTAKDLIDYIPKAIKSVVD